VSASSFFDVNDSILRGHNQDRTPLGLLSYAHLSSTTTLCGAWSRKSDCRSSAPVVVGSRGLDATSPRDFRECFSGDSPCNSRLGDAVAYSLLAAAYSLRRQ